MLIVDCMEKHAAIAFYLGAAVSDQGAILDQAENLYKRLNAHAGQQHA